MGRAVRLVTVGIVGLGLTWSVGALAAVAKSKSVPDSCTLVTKADISAAFATLDPVFQPTTVGEPTKSKPISQGGHGPAVCDTALQLPNSVGVTVDVDDHLALSIARFGCPPKGMPGKKITVGKTKALLEPLPDRPQDVRDIAFPYGKVCVYISIPVSGGPNRVPASAFVSLAKAALAKKS